MTFKNPRPIHTLKPGREVLLAGGRLLVNGTPIGLGCWQVGILHPDDARYYLLETQGRVELFDPDFWHPLPYVEDNFYPRRPALWRRALTWARRRFA